MNVGIAEKINEVRNEKTFAKKVATLQSLGDTNIKFVLGHTYDPRIKFAINPVDIPEYKSQPKESDLQNVFKSEMKRFYILLDCPKAGKMAYKTRMDYLTDLLEMTDPDDAELITNMIRGEIPGLSLKVFSAAYPHMIKDYPDDKKVPL
jgi:hypothetical protein